MRSLKKYAIHFLELAASGRAPEAFEKYAAPGFKHHNPYFKSDARTLCSAMQENAISHPGKVLEVQRALQEGQLVAVHSRVRLGEGKPVMSVVHIFRFEAEHVAELWDVGQAVPDHSPNEHGMF